MYSATSETVTVARGQSKYGPRKEPMRLQDSLPCPLWKSNVAYKTNHDKTEKPDWDFFP